MHLVQSEMRRILFMLWQQPSCSRASLGSLLLLMFGRLNYLSDCYVHCMKEPNHTQVQVINLGTLLRARLLCKHQWTKHLVTWASILYIMLTLPDNTAIRLSDQDSGHVMHRKLAHVTRLFIHLQLLNSMAYEIDINNPVLPEALCSFVSVLWASMIADLDLFPHHSRNVSGAGLNRCGWVGVAWAPGTFNCDEGIDLPSCWLTTLRAHERRASLRTRSIPSSHMSRQ